MRGETANPNQIATAAARLCRPCLRYSLDKCVRRVCRDIASVTAISLSEKSLAIRERISTSRGLNRAEGLLSAPRLVSSPLVGEVGLAHPAEATSRPRSARVPLSTPSWDRVLAFAGGLGLVGFSLMLSCPSGWSSSL